MSGDREPRENISGEYGNPISDPVTTLSDSRLGTIIDRLGTLYWRKSYGDRDAFSCLVRTILSQHTSDVASQPAYDDLVDRFGEASLAHGLRSSDTDDIAELIQPAGLQHQKAAVLQDVASKVLERFGSTEAFDAFVKEHSRESVRDALLSFDGVGPKTADCVLLFSGGKRGVFPVDTHIHRIYRRLGIAPPDASHEVVRALLEGRTDDCEGVPPSKCGFGHTTSIQFGREYCTARAPVCLSDVEACPLSDLCHRVGVDVEEGTVVDPADHVTATE